MLINSQDTSEWPAIAGDNETFNSVTQSALIGSNLSIPPESSDNTTIKAEAASTTTSASDSGAGWVMSAATQSSGQSQAQTGASLSRMTDNATSQSVIHSTSSANMLHSDVLDQSSNNNQAQSWLDSSSSSMGWDKKNMHSTPSTPRLDTNQQFSGWGPTQFSAPFNSEGNSSQWGASSANNMQSTWGSQSPSLSKQQSMSDWGVNTTSTISANQWGTPSTASVTASGESSWGQPKRLANTGADGWGQNSQADSPPSMNQSNPSNVAAQQQPSSQWSQPPQVTPPPSVWQANSGTGAAVTSQIPASVPTSMPGNGTASSKQWGATSVTGQLSTSPTSTAIAFSSQSCATAATVLASSATTTSTPTSWAGAAAKGLPKAQPKPPEPVDPVQLQIEQSINNPDGWGRVPVRQDTSWGKPPEKKKQDDSNQWQASPNNGTAIWEASKTSNGLVENDKSTWNQKVAGNNDPNVWNGEGSKGKDNALWDDVSSSKEQEPLDQTKTWNTQGSTSRTISQSSGGDNSDGGWANTGISRTSPPTMPGSQPASAGIVHDPPNWASATNGSMDPSRKNGNRWDGNPTPNRTHSVSDVGGTSYWETGSQSKPSGGWNSGPKSQNSWNSGGESGPSIGGNSWMQNQSMGGANSWGGDNGGGGTAASHWQGQGSRKQSMAWDENPVGEFRDRRQFKSESDAMSRDDADMGDWNESNSVWSSANGFKQSRRPPPISESAMTVHMQQQRMPGNGGVGGVGCPTMNGTQNLTKHQMLNMLMQMGFPKDDAHSALIQNDMNLQGAINDLKKSNNSPQLGPGGPMGDYNKFNPNIPPPMSMNTPFGNNAQANQSVVQQSSHHKPNQMRNPVGQVRGSSVQQHQQRIIVQQLQLGVSMGNIHPQILNLPLNDRILRSIQQLLNLQQNYQHHYENLMRQKNSNPGNSQPVEMNPLLMGIKQQMKVIQQPLIAPNQMPKTSVGDARGLDISPLSMNPGGAPVGNQQSGSRLGIWTDKAPGGKQGAPSTSSSLHASHSTPNLQGGVAAENNPWSTASSSNGAAWANIGTGSTATQFLDSQNESHSTGSANQSPNHRPITQSSGAPNPNTSSQNSFDIPEFVPGQPWQGSSLNKIEDDPNITPGSVARSISVTTAGLNSDWGGSLGKGTWANSGGLGGGAAESWSKGGTRPPPGFNKNVNRSLSMPQGPSEKTSAFSPVGSTWDSKQSMAGGSTWLVLRNLTPQIDGATLKTLCSQHGPLLNFFVNQNNGQALVQYATNQEGVKAHKSLNSCVLGNTTIMTEFVDESEAQRILDQRQGSLGRSSSMSAAPGSAMWPTSNSSMWGNSVSGSISSAAGSTWGNSLLDQQPMSSGADFLPANEYSM